MYIENMEARVGESYKSTALTCLRELESEVLSSSSLSCLLLTSCCTTLRSAREVVA